MAGIDNLDAQDDVPDSELTGCKRCFPTVRSSFCMHHPAPEPLDGFLDPPIEIV